MMMTKAPEQFIVDQLEAAGYSAETIISYLEARVEREWENADFEECGPGERMVYGICRKVDGAPEIDPESGKPKKIKEEDKKSLQEKRLEAAAKAQGSAPDNNKKVVIDGKAYGWAIQNGKPVMVAWGSIAGEKKVGPKVKGKRKARETRASSSTQGRLKGLQEALKKQTTESGKRAIQKQIDELT